MANNRMFLLHRPSGKAVYLGKRMGWGWYSVPDNIRDRIVELFRMVEDQEAAGEQDDFCIALETVREGSTLATDKWNYSHPMENDKGIRTFEMPNDKLTDAGPKTL